MRRALQVRDAAGVRRSVGAAIPISFRDEHIELVHGAGGKASRRLIEGLIAPHLVNGSTAPLGDAAIVALRSASVAVTTDAVRRAAAALSRRFKSAISPSTAP